MNRLSGYALAALVLAPAFVPIAARAGAVPLPETAAGQVAAKIDNALQGRDSLGAHELELDNPTLTLPKGWDGAALRLESLAFDAKSGRLTAALTPATGTAPIGGPDTLRVTGRVYQLIDAVVPARAIDPGETISARDLDHASVRLDHGASDALIDANEVIGRTPRHQLRPREPLHAFDLQLPVVIHRGDLVTMTLEMPLMTLTTQGQALEDAARGAVVRISNGKTSRVVEGVARGPGSAVVQPPVTP